MIIHILNCGYINIYSKLLYSGGGMLADLNRAVLAPELKRTTLPVHAFLIEHPAGLFLVDTGWSRAISPAGVYDPASVNLELPRHLAALYKPFVPTGMAACEQLASMGIAPEDLAAVLITHVDPDHVSGLRSLRRARRIIIPEDEAYWSVRTKYRMRQPRDLWDIEEKERIFYRGHLLGPMNKAFDVTGDGSIMMVNIPGHTDGMAGVLVRSGSSYSSGSKFVLLASDAAITPRNWEQMEAPGFAADYTLQHKTLSWIAQMAQDPACAGIYCSHDPGIHETTITL